MNNNTKHKYIPCEVKMVEFNVEHPFATAGNYTWSLNPQKTIYSLPPSVINGNEERVAYEFGERIKYEEPNW